MSSGPEGAQPVLLLKTKSAPADHYEELFSAPRDGFAFEPEFIPVLEHQLLDDGMNSFKELLQERKISNREDAAYGGLIFTSQRAVEAFAKLVEDGKGEYTFRSLKPILRTYPSFYPFYPAHPVQDMHSTPMPPPVLEEIPFGLFVFRSPATAYHHKVFF